jgi:hypothetical protein
VTGLVTVTPSSGDYAERGGTMENSKPKLIKRRGKDRKQKKKKLSYEDRVFRKVYRLFEQDLIDAWGDAETLGDFNPEEFNAKQPIVRAYYNAYHKLINLLKNEFRPLLFTKQEWKPPKWLYGTKKLTNALENNKFVEFYTYIYNHTFQLRDIEQMVEAEIIDMHFKTDKDKKGFYPIVFMPNYQHIQNTLGMSRSLIQRYLDRFTQAGIVKLIKRLDRGKKVYSLGYYQDYLDETENIPRHRQVAFLKNTPEIKRAIVELRIRW